jgi:hypothetical protein
MYSLTDDLTHLVIPDLIRNLVFLNWIPAFAGMTLSEYRKGIIEPSE